MRAPGRKASTPRIRAFGPTFHRSTAAPVAPASGGVFREFVAALEKLERAKRRKPRGTDPKGA
ncbi:MAG: hypothetical protein B7Y61_10400 [Rhizobiales bacterium 35-66-30]|jgi:hypothetical protein|nr:MAG: hypothetical protein B7Y61_10400 [Rhizobiales bacterium 35-66-30]OZA98612.1 MAG: hypothetical protein B7X67_21935 [Rhizobiales bacterium 39-66-18]